MQHPATTLDHPRRFIAGWFIDGSGAPARRRVLVSIDENGLIRRIEAGAPDSGKAAGSAADLRSCTILPPLIDSHVHLALSGTTDEDARHRQLTASYPETKPVIDAHILAHLSRGILGLRDGGDYGAYALRYKMSKSTDPSFPLFLRAAGRAWHAPGRYGKLIGRSPAARQTLAQAITSDQDPSDHVKIVQSGLNSLKEFGRQTPPQFNRAELEEAFRAARSRGLRIMVHANGALPVKEAIAAGCDSIEHGFFMGEANLCALAEKRITWVPTAVTMQAYDRSLPGKSPERSVCRRNLEAQILQIARAYALGVRIAAGSDAGSLGVHHGRGLIEELALLMEAGLPVEAAVACGTSQAAALLGLDNDLGVLAPGRPATFLAAAGSPDALPFLLDGPLEIYIRGKRLKHG